MGKLELRSRFYVRWAEKSNRKSPRGAPIIWRMRVKQERKMTPEPLNTLGGIMDGFVWLSGFSLRRKKKEKKEKIALFRFIAPPGFEPTTTKKMAKTTESCTFPRPSLGGQSRKVRRLSRETGKIDI